MLQRVLERTPVLAAAVVALLLFGLCLVRNAAVQLRPIGDLIAVVPMATTDDYWRSIHAGALEAAKELKVQVLWQGPLTYDRNAQLDILETMIVRRVSALVVAPIDRNAARAAVENANRCHIPVIVIDSDLNSRTPVSFISTNNYRAGVLAAGYLAKLLQGKGKVAILQGMAGNASAGNRGQGFIDGVKQHSGLELVSSNQRIGGSFEESYKAAENLLARFRTGEGRISIDGMFCPNESSTFAMLRAIEDNKLTGKVRFIGFDSSRKLNDALYQGKIDCLVVQNPKRMGYLGVKTAVDFLHGMQIATNVDTGVTLATPQNAHDPAVHELLEPDLSRWLQ